MLCILFYLNHVIFCASLSLNIDLNVNECIIAVLKEAREYFILGKERHTSSLRSYIILTPPGYSAEYLICFSENS